ncbi:ATP-binding protein [Bacillus mesophilus]|nr:ATP-binding protein [Bacillus mesophilus]
MNYKQINRLNPLVIFSILIVSAFILLLFLLLLFDIEITNQTLYLVIIPYFFISSMCSYILHSILENKSLQKQQESEERYKNLVENHPDGILIHHNGIILYANPAMYQLLGYEYGTATGDSILKYAHPSTHEIIARRQEEAYRGNENACYDLLEIELIHSSGRPLYVESKAILCYYNQLKCVQLVLRDISERKKTEELLMVSDKLAVVGQLAAGIAHEIRNPLTSIKGFIQVMRESAHSTLYYDVILSELDRLNQVTNDFLILAKPQAKDFRRFDLNKIISEIITLLKPEALLHQVDINLHTVNQEVTVLCDVNELKQAFINILKNSTEAITNGGTIDVTVELVNEVTKVSIQDNGVGIPKDRLHNIGQPFYTLKEKGTGLGLMTTIKIIENHNGIFRIHSEENKGTTVIVEFPHH